MAGFDRDEDLKRHDAKYNIFKFQDHLLFWITVVAESFYDRDYPSAFEALQNLYCESRGFFDDREKEELKKLFKEARKKNEEYISYNIQYERIRRKIANHTYRPPTDVYDSLLNFRIALMEYMAKHNMLIIMIKKGVAGAGAQM